MENFNFFVHSLLPKTMPSIVTSDSKADELIAPVSGLDVPPTFRPDNITTLIESVDRYNPESLVVLEDYLAQQCGEGTFDCLADLAILKLYQFNPEHAKVEETTNILVKALTTFSTNPSFSLCLHLLPPHVLLPNALDALSEAVQKLSMLATFLDSAQFEAFWDEFNSDDLYLDYTADVYGFEDSIRRGIARTVALCNTRIKREILEKWVNLSGEAFESWIKDQTGWTIDGEVVVILPNSENVASSGGVKGENLRWEVIRDRLLKHPQF